MTRQIPCQQMPALASFSIAKDTPHSSLAQLAKSNSNALVYLTRSSKIGNMFRHSNKPN